MSTAGYTKVRSLLGEALIAMKPIHMASGVGEAVPTDVLSEKVNQEKMLIFAKKQGDAEISL